MEYAVLILIVLMSTLLIIWPLLKGGISSCNSTSPIEQEILELDIKKDGIYQAIKELEFDLAMGKISQEDFEKMRAQYMFEAIECLKKIDHLHHTDGDETHLHQESLEGKIEEKVPMIEERLNSEKKERFCNQCGNRVELRDRFCFYCGAKLRGS